MPRRRKYKSLKDICDDLWRFCIYLRAGYKSEYSGRPGRQIGGAHILHAHHLSGKANYALRYALSNGMCLTSGEHKFIAHHTGRQDGFREKVKKMRGEDLFDRLAILKHQGTRKLPLSYYHVFLQETYELLLKNFNDGKLIE